MYGVLFKVEGERLCLECEDHSAAYPLIIFFVMGATFSIVDTIWLDLVAIVCRTLLEAFGTGFAFLFC